jgi:hypothetical protein
MSNKSNRQPEIDPDHTEESCRTELLEMIAAVYKFARHMRDFHGVEGPLTPTVLDVFRGGLIEADLETMSTAMYEYASIAGIVDEETKLMLEEAEATGFVVPDFLQDHVARRKAEGTL